MVGTRVHYRRRAISGFIEHDWTVIMVLRPGDGRTCSALVGHNVDSEAALCRLLDELTAEWPKNSLGDSRCNLRWWSRSHEICRTLSRARQYIVAGQLSQLSFMAQYANAYRRAHSIQSTGQTSHKATNTRATAPLPRSKLDAADRTPHYIAS